MQQAVRTVANRYSNDATEQLRTAIAARHRVPADHVVLACGSSEILRAAATTQWRYGWEDRRRIADLRMVREILSTPRNEDRQGPGDQDVRA